MLYFAIILVAGICLFSIGYYIGNQIGRTEHIRRHLEQAREAKCTSTMGALGG